MIIRIIVIIPRSYQSHHPDNPNHHLIKITMRINPQHNHNHSHYHRTIIVIVRVSPGLNQQQLSFGKGRATEYTTDSGLCRNGISFKITGILQV